MKRLTCWLVAGVLGLGVVGALASSAWAEEAKEKGKAEKEKKVTLEQVPAAVKATILKEAGENKVEEIEVETEEGREVYEAEWEVNGREVEVKVASDGTLVERETEVTLEQVPSAVKATILKEAGENKIEEIEEVVAGSKKSYEAEWKADGKETEVQVAADGKLLGKKVEEEGDDEDEKEEGEQKVTLDQVPAAVKATILKEAGENTVEEIEAETEDGREVYEAEWKVGGKEVEIKVASDGTLLKKEVESDEKEDDD